MPERPPTTGLAWFNSAPPAELSPLLTACLAVPSWVTALLAGRPYSTVDALLAAADRAARSLTAAEIRAALAGHPRLGEPPASAGASARWARAEQAGVPGRDPDLAERLRLANLRYEERFGHVYLVSASGRGGEELLADLWRRLDNDPRTELRVVNRELRAIAALRLRRVLAEDAGPGRVTG
ncbi:2-oxo-4-hydroxy-4-carboxy-5-ureidoimidazoline decarboxylase [Goodfellowiella coeruleoviolacea]|uniref:2-oxo-4-hydroxy-4-carboxy-5-ureidoimidazoline decarboxylase n=1 Tax=Goodfellowiella coeruleoviolacea TaxID=334858 RepID=A0AAE3GBV6_9PSEU|nr:2-oxo-4-hydroxy-4-carboxy-5-ureidoimidazoline decarboxylase [Goodfellowiella coeruleoviolacea]MCP2165376.1 2-oxo-4-hydroxy-4-carboxy-5-ureidoimidazoline decarboxylase [Goodfellowiella coeruleoviolacea]